MVTMDHSSLPSTLRAAVCTAQLVSRGALHSFCATLSKNTEHEHVRVCVPQKYCKQKEDDCDMKHACVPLPIPETFMHKTLHFFVSQKCHTGVCLSRACSTCTLSIPCMEGVRW
ncbi:hypothetical protein CHARACLAT_019169 [Characodon lateralis]|uniref:Secreted protein n=1 Tax=Characodon lateralis TaxID=208331 RepID=A0ABU7DHX9_9TELE|nr:hypothetical protein [Characodon lateralis]